MTLLQLKVKVPDDLAREAEAAGLLTPKSLSNLLREAMRRQAGERLLAGVTRAKRAGSRPLSMRALQKEVKAVRAARKASAIRAAGGKRAG
jgi:hypothetical protein